MGTCDLCPNKIDYINSHVIKNPNGGILVICENCVKSKSKTNGQ